MIWLVLTLLLSAVCLVTTVKCAFIDALHTGRIYKQRWTVHDPWPQHPTGGPFSYLGIPTAGVLEQDEWLIFQNRERVFRKTLDTNYYTLRINLASTSPEMRRQNGSNSLSPSAVKMGDPFPFLEIHHLKFEENANSLGISWELGRG